MKCELCNKELKSDDHRFNHLRAVHNLTQKDLGCRWCRRKDVQLSSHTPWCELNPNRDSNRKKSVESNSKKDKSVFRTSKYREEASIRRSKILSGETREYQHKFLGRIDYFTVKCRKEEVQVLGTWERDFANYLNSQKVDWVRPSPLIWIDREGQKRRYTPDFFLVEQQIFVEVKGYLSEYDIDKMERASRQNCITIKLLRRREIESIRNGSYTLNLELLPQYPNW